MDGRAASGGGVGARGPLCSRTHTVQEHCLSRAFSALIIIDIVPGVRRQGTARDERVGGDRRLDPTNGRRPNERTNEQAALVDGSGGVCDYRGIRSLYIRIYRGGGGGGGDYDIRGRRRRRSHGPQCAFSDGPGRAQETDRKHALPVHNGPMAAIQEHTGNERVRRGKRKNRSINPRSRQKEQPLGGKREVCNNVNDFFFTHSTRRCRRRRPHSRATLPCRHWIRSNLHFLYILLTQSFIFYLMKNIKNNCNTFPISCIFSFYFEL